MSDTSILTISVDDIINTIRSCSGRDWHIDDALAFASDLTGLSIDALWEMIDQEPESPDIDHLDCDWRNADDKASGTGFFVKCETCGKTGLISAEGRHNCCPVCGPDVIASVIITPFKEESL